MCVSHSWLVGADAVEAEGGAASPCCGAGGRAQRAEQAAHATPTKHATQANPAKQHAQADPAEQANQALAFAFQAHAGPAGQGDPALPAPGVEAGHGDGAGSEAWLGPPLPADPYAVDFTRGIYLVGILHVVNGLTENLSTALFDYNWFVDLLTHVSRLLATRWSRDRFLETCCDGPRAALRGSFMHFSAGVYKGRWGSVMETLSKLLPLEQEFRACWDLKKLLLRSRMREDGGGGKQINVNLVSEAARSSYFWAYANALDRIGECLSSLAHWAEGCPCHSGLPVPRGPARHHSRQVARPPACPLASRRAPECASGALREIMRRMFDIVNASLAICPSMLPCSEEERARILAEFARARRFIQFGLQVKTVVQFNKRLRSGRLRFRRFGSLPRHDTRERNAKRKPKRASETQPETRERNAKRETQRNALFAATSRVAFLRVIRVCVLNVGGLNVVVSVGVEVAFAFAFAFTRWSGRARISGSR